MQNKIEALNVVDENATIVTERLVLHALRPEDADEIVDVLRDSGCTNFTGGRPLTLDELRLRYRRLAVGRSAEGEQTWLNWIIRLRDSSCGAVGTVQATLTGIVHGRLRRMKLAGGFGRGWDHPESAWQILAGKFLPSRQDLASEGPGRVSVGSTSLESRVLWFWS